MEQKKLNIFYTDDDRDDILFFEDAVAKASNDINLVTHFDGGDLLHLLDNPPPKPAMLFLDWNMPGKDGAFVLKSIREDDRTKELPVIILSTSDYIGNIEHARELGANMYITKPATFRELVDIIKYCLEIDWQSFKPEAGTFVYNRS